MMNNIDRLINWGELSRLLAGSRSVVTKKRICKKHEEKVNELTVDYLYYLGRQQLGDNCFYTIKDHETPDPSDFGYNSIDEVDFAACGFYEQIEYAIEQHILNLETFEA